LRIKERGIYTKEEIKQILDEQNAERKRQKNEELAAYADFIASLDE